MYLSFFFLLYSNAVHDVCEQVRLRRVYGPCSFICTKYLNIGRHPLNIVHINIRKKYICFGTAIYQSAICVFRKIAKQNHVFNNSRQMKSFILYRLDIVL